MSIHNKNYLGANYDKLSKVHIFVCGAGALGSNLLVGLAQEGYTNLSVIDFDKVDRNNAWTQIYGLRDNGCKKSPVLRGYIARKLNINITSHDCRLDSHNVKKFLKGVDLVVDTFDNWESRQLVSSTCRELGVECVHGGMSESGYSEVKWNDDYHIPTNPSLQDDICEYPLAGPLIKVTHALLQTVITHYIVTGEKLNRTFTLRDCTMRNF